MGVYPPFKLTFWIKIGRLIPVAVQFLSPRSNSSEDENTGEKCNSSYSKERIHNTLLT